MLGYEKRYCDGCREEFALANVCPEGWDRYSYRCKPCQTEYFESMDPKLVKYLWPEGVESMIEQVEYK